MKLFLVLMLSLSLFACDRLQSPSSSNIEPARMESKVVPQALRHLIPLVQKWGIGDDVLRAEHEEKATLSEKQALYDAVAPYRTQINSWLDTYKNDMPDEAAMYMYTLLAMEEMGI